jgi:RHS repeat-associated protein
LRFSRDGKGLSSGTLASANVYRFSSKELHVNSGLYYYGYRWYAPNLQRWLNRDPIKEPGFEILRTKENSTFPIHYPIATADLARYIKLGAFTGLDQNAYTFVNNDSIDFSDPNGLAIPRPACLYICANATWPVGNQFLCLLIESRNCKSCPKGGWAEINYEGIYTMHITACPTLLASSNDGNGTSALNSYAR